jgi:uncharacterized protein DUF6444
VYIARGVAVGASPPVPAGGSWDAATWNQTPLVVPPLVIHLLTVTRQQAARLKTLEARLADLEARGQQNSRPADRPPSSDPPWVPPPPQVGRRGPPGRGPGIQAIARPCGSRPR